MTRVMSRFGCAGVVLGIAATFLTGCGRTTTVAVVDDPRLEAEFEAVLVERQTRTLGDVAQVADLGGESWDRMYYFRVPMLANDVNRTLDTPGLVWEDLPAEGSSGLIVFTSEGDVVHAVSDRAPALALSGFATADSVVSAADLGGYARIGVESKGR